MKALKRTLTLLLTAAVMTAAIPYAVSATVETATVSDGTTDSAEQIGISTAEEFLAMESGKSYYLKNDIDFAGKTYVTLVATFNGVLDGRGHALKNFTLANESATADGHMGVFGKVCDGGYTTVKNLVIGSADAPISMTNHANADGYHGFLAGQGTSAFYIGQFENITVYGNYTNTQNAKCFTGGIIGRTYRFALRDCTMNGSFADVSSTTNKQEENVGGLVGLTESGTQTVTSVMENCTNNASVTINGSGSVRVGGLIGFSGSVLKIEGCSNTGDISGKDYAGGLVGVRWGSDLYIKNSNSTGAVETATNKGTLYGGNNSASGVASRFLYITGCGDHDTTDVIEVSSLADLQGMTEAGKVYRLTKDLDLKDGENSKVFANFVFSGSDGFNGVFDGNGHSIYNFSINGIAGSDAGFFNKISGKTGTLITNLTLGSAENPITVTAAEENGKSVGLLAASCVNTTKTVTNADGTKKTEYDPKYASVIDGVSIYSNVTHTGKKANIAGFIGVSRVGALLNCTFSGSINATPTLTASDWCNVSAFIADVEADHTLFYNCANYANLGITTATAKEARAAGMVGYSTKNNDFIKCANFGDIKVDVTTATEVSAAGFRARLNGTSSVLASDCTNFGNISSSKYASGFFAWAKNPLALIDVVNFGTVSGADATKDAFYNYSGDLVINKETQTELPVTKLACTTAASDLNFTMQTGASVRLETPAGLRFQATVNTDGLYWERMSMYTEVGYGMLISPAVFVSGAGAFTREALDAYADARLHRGSEHLCCHRQYQQVVYGD